MTFLCVRCYPTQRFKCLTALLCHYLTRHSFDDLDLPDLYPGLRDNAPWN